MPIHKRPVKTKVRFPGSMSSSRTNSPINSTPHSPLPRTPKVVELPFSDPQTSQQPQPSRTNTASSAKSEPEPTYLSPGPTDPHMFDDANVNTFSSRAIPNLFRHPPIVQDLLRTQTSIEQDKVVHSCLQFLADSLNPLPDLKRDAHVDFLNWALGIDKEGEQLPKGFTKMDASRPWLLYWCLAGLYALGEDLTQYRPRLFSTLRSIQNPDGGFGGGNGQISHLAPTYAAVMSLVMVGGKDALDLVDRKSMWRFITSMKKPHGGFSMCKDGEEDVRGVYCALSVIALLQLPLDMPGGKIGGLVEGTAEYIGRCQTYEGGLAGAPGGLEAHGGYIFCGLASLSILGPPWEMFQKHIDLPSLISWVTARQYAPEGGFSGRTNKLVDGCYSSWVGGTFALLEGALNGPVDIGPEENREPQSRKISSLWSREGLSRYILACCQDSYGGLRDKPGKSADFYHSCYVLLGLSSAQNYYFPHTDNQVTETLESPPLKSPFLWTYSSHIPTKNESQFEYVPGTYDEGDQSFFQDTQRGMKWYNELRNVPPTDEMVEGFRAGNRVAPLHPVFNIPFEKVRESWEYYQGRPL